MTSDRLKELLDSFSTKRILVVGDFFLDKYLEFDPSLAETSFETGKVANQVTAVRHYPGAAGTVAQNLAALKVGEIIAVGFTGDDGEGHDLRRDLQKLGCNTNYLFCIEGPNTPTYLKPVNCTIPGLEGECERFDTKNHVPLLPEIEEKIIEAITELIPWVDAVIIADQVQEEECGAIASGVRGMICELAGEYPETIFWADSRERIGLFTNVMTKPNQQEAVRAVFGHDNADDELVKQAGQTLCRRSGKPVFISRSEKGMLVFDGDEFLDIRGVRVEGPVDITGAGDTVTASAVLTLASGGSLEEAAILANLTASIVVQQIGVTGAAKPEDLPPRLWLWHKQG